MPEPITTVPATAERWEEVREVFGPRGGYGGCWCLYWRLPGGQWREGCGEPNRERLHQRLSVPPAPGVLARLGSRPAGWVAVAPWARGRGVARALIHAASEHARSWGATAVEAYPVDLEAAGHTTADELYTGALDWFLDAGFREVDRRRPARPIVRRELAAAPGRGGPAPQAVPRS